jgi:uncharacterized protein (DUF1501 family)
MMSKVDDSRRSFLKQSSALSAAAWVGAPMFANLSAMADASAAVNSGYKALVCIFLGGGNDAFGTVFKDDDVTWNNYVKHRGEPGVLPALVGPRDTYIKLSDTSLQGVGPTYNLHPALADMAAMFSSKRLSIVGGVGPLRQLTNRGNYPTASVPPKLFSHNDQASVWLTTQPEGSGQGWGGAAWAAWANTPGSGQTTVEADNSNRFATVGVSAAPAFLTAKASAFSRSVSAYSVGTRGALPMSSAYASDSLFNYFKPGWLTTAWSGAYPTTVNGKTTTYMTSTLAGDLEKDIVKVNIKSHGCELALRKEGLGPFDPANRAASEFLQGVEVIIAAIKASGQLSAGQASQVQRQVFFIELPGFDTHAQQRAKHDELLKALNDGFKLIHDSLGADMDAVTVFTASDFGRKFKRNDDGTDHGWGGHHFVMGGALSGQKGGRILGSFPSLPADVSTLAATDMVLDDGTMIPSTPVSSYVEPLANWFGVPDFKAMWNKLDPVAYHLPTPLTFG